jgi:hypothetical protein
MRYTWLLLILVSLLCGCDESVRSMEQRYDFVEGTVKDVRVSMNVDAMKGNAQSGHIYTIVTFTDERTVTFKGLSPQPILIDNPTRIFYRFDAIVGVKLLTPKGPTSDNDNGTPKGVKTIPD